MSYLKYIFFFLSVFNLLSPGSYSQTRNIGKATYQTCIPKGEIGPSTYATFPSYPVAASQAIPKIISGFPKPVQTHDWWTSFIWNASASAYFNQDEHSWPSFAHPLAYQACRYGLKIKYPDIHRTFDFNEEPKGSYRFEMGAEDLTVTVDGLDLSSKKRTLVKDYSDWSFTALWDNDNGHSFTATMGHGFLYTYFKDIKGDIIIRCNGNPTIFKNDGNALGITINKHHYALFVPEGTSWETGLQYSFDENEYTAGSSEIISKPAFRFKNNAKNYFSIAILPDNEINTFNKFRRHAFCFIDSTEVNWAYDEPKGILETRYVFHTSIMEGQDSSAIYALYRHQWLHLKKVSTDLTYQSPRGTMKVHEGNAFSIKLKNFGIIPILPVTDADSEIIQSLIEEESEKISGTITHSDSYFGAIRIARLAEMAYLSHLYNDHASREMFLDKVQASLEQWFSGSFFYDSIWNTFIAYPALYGSESNLNDHHFHYGYFIRASALLALFRPEWANDEAFGGIVKMLIKDVANCDRKDKMFPFLRFFDSYAGHSWAGGSANGWAGIYPWGEDQESSSESMNFSSSVYLWGMVTKNTSLRNLGLYLYLNEKMAIEQYWFDVDNEVFPSDYHQVSATRVWSSGADKVPYDSGTEDEYLLGINSFPPFASALYLSTIPDYLRKNYDNMVERNGGQPDFFKDLMCFYLSLTNSAEAFSLYPEVSDYTNIPQAGLLHWLTAIELLGNVDTTISSNHSSGMVFKNNSNYRYVVFNPGPEKAVVFSDGFKITVPEDTLVMYKSEVIKDTINKENPEQDKAREYRIFPNPGKGTFNTKAIPSDTRYELINQFGTSILKKKILENQKFQFSITQPGVYFLHYENEKDNGTMKVVMIK